MLVGVPSVRKHEQHLILLDQLPHLFDGFRRAIAVVAADEIDLAAVDATLLVDHVEIGGFGLAEDAVGRGRPAIRHGVTDLDLGIAGAGAVLAAGKSDAAHKPRNRPRTRPLAMFCLNVMLIVMMSSLFRLEPFAPF